MQTRNQQEVFVPTRSIWASCLYTRTTTYQAVGQIGKQWPALSPILRPPSWRDECYCPRSSALQLHPWHTQEY